MLYNEFGFCVKENALNKDDYDFLRHSFYAPDFPWLFLDNTSGILEGVETWSLVHTPYDKEKNPEGFEHIKNEVIYTAFYNYLDKYYSDVDIFRIRIGNVPFVNGEVEHGIHADTDTPHHTALFYFCTDKDGGYTHLYNKRWDEELQKQYESLADYVIKEAKNIPLAARVLPIENRVVLFDGLVLHSSTTPKSISRRIAVNVNFTGQPR